MHGLVRIVQTVADIRPAETLVVIPASGVEEQLLKTVLARVVHHRAL